MMWQIGDRVLANWKHDIYWYPATIRKIDGERIYVKFDDGDKEWTTAENLLEIDVEVGDRVHCRWQNGRRYYSGLVTSKEGETIYIHYDDGDKEETTINKIRVTR